MTELVCIVCPKGCRMKVDDGNDFLVTDHSCSRGEVYALDELRNPVRVLTSTIRAEGGFLRRCPVKTDGAIPKGKLMEAMRILDSISIPAPIQLGQTVAENICNTGVNVIATRNIISSERRISNE